MENQQLRAVFFQEDQVWVGQCLEYDISAQGSNAPEAFERLMLTIRVEASISREPFHGIASAPPHFHEMYAKASMEMRDAVKDHLTLEVGPTPQTLPELHAKLAA